MGSILSGNPLETNCFRCGKEYDGYSIVLRPEYSKHITGVIFWLWCRRSVCRFCGFNYERTLNESEHGRYGVLPRVSRNVLVSLGLADEYIEKEDGGVCDMS